MSDETATLESAALRLLLVEHPAMLTEEELERELHRQRDASAPGSVAEAIDALVGAGLVNRAGGLVLPSRAALVFDRLSLD